jgi:hypothetical protein
MKKMYLVLIAVIMAIGFSAFTPSVNKKAINVITYQDDNLDWHVFTGDPCPGDEIPECLKMTPHGQRQLFYNYDTQDPVKRNAP